MNRRKFFSSMLGGLVASAAVRTWPFRVFSFPQKVMIPSVKFIRAFDPVQSRMVCRWDMLYGFGTIMPDGAVRILE